MFAMRARVASGGLQVRDHIALGKDRQPLNQLGCKIAPAGADERRVKLAIADCDLAEIAGCGAVETFEGGGRFCAVLVGGSGRGERRGIRLDLQAEVVDLVELGRRHRPDEIAAVSLAGEQPVLLEPRQRFAQRYLADPELIGERVLADWGILWQSPGDDLLANDFEDLVGQGSDDNAHGRSVPSEAVRFIGPGNLSRRGLPDQSRWC